MRGGKKVPGAGPPSNLHTKRKPSSSTSPATSTNGTTTPTPAPVSAAVQGQHDRFTFLLTALIGSIVTVQTRSSAAYTGILTAAHLDGDVSVALTRARTTGSTECKPTPLLIMAKDILSISADAVDLASNVAAAVQGERGPDATTSFRTDVEITGAPLDPSAGRPLQKWSDEVEEDDGPNLGASGSRPWNQFETNERLFGATTNYNEEIYTTKLDRSGRDFKERERKAERLAQQILSSTTANPHLAEERGQVVQGQLDEEDKYSGVQRGPNAYVPPSARKNGPVQMPASVPSKPATNGVVAPTAARPTAPVVRPQAAAPAAPVAATDEKEKKEAAPAHKGGDALYRDFKAFVGEEKKRLQPKKAQAVAKAKDDTLAEFKKFSQNFTLKMPVPQDLVPLLAKDEKKQQQLMSGPSAIPSKAVNEIKTPAPASSTANTPQLQQAKLAPRFASPAPALKEAATAAPKPLLKKSLLPEIPSFAELRAIKERKQQQAGAVSKVEDWVKSQGQKPVASSGVSAAVAELKSPSPAPSAGSKINVNAREFVPNPKAVAFTPGFGSPARKPAELPTEAARASPHPFFGNKVITRGEPTMHVKEDFTPFKLVASVDPTGVPCNWPFTGRSYKFIFGPNSAPPPAAEEMDARSVSSGPSGAATPAQLPPNPNGPMQQMTPHMMQPGGSPYPMYYPPMGYRYPVQPPPGQYQGGPMPPPQFVPQLAFQPGQPQMYSPQMAPYFNPASPPMMNNQPPGGYRKMSMTPSTPQMMPGPPNMGPMSMQGMAFPPQGPPPPQQISPGPPA